MFVGVPATKDWSRPKTYDIVAQNGSKTVKVTFFVRHGDQFPVAVLRWNFANEDRCGLLGSGVSRSLGHVGDGQYRNHHQEERDSFHDGSSFK
jgi:hypothetical protein